MRVTLSAFFEEVNNNKTFLKEFKIEFEIMSEKTGSKRKREEKRDGSASKVKPDPEKKKPEREPAQPGASLVKSEAWKREDFSDDDESPSVKVKVELNPEQSRQCPYLDTIDRNVLDFGKFGSE